MKTRELLLASVAFLLFCQPVVAAPVVSDSVRNGFRFPLPFVGALTSTFSEYRTGHFHAGVDLSTDGKIGMPVVAVRSGHVYRVRVSGGGYGKAVDLLLDNGMLATYGHLDRFSEEIESFVRSEQVERQNYEVDVFPRPLQIPVAAGAIIGYSGNTGFSFGPHLHFELRRGEVALNPLSNVFFIAERVSPTFRFIKLTPVDPGCEIDGEETPHVFSVRRSRETGVYRSPALPEVAGAFLVEVSVFDRTEKADNKLSVYEQKLFLDDSLLFGTRFDEIESSRTHEVELAYDCGLAKRGELYTFNLCRFPGSKLRLLSKLAPGAGVIDTDLLGLSGRHTLRIEASDAGGNTSTAFLEFVANRRPLVDSVAVLMKESSLFVRAEVEDPEDDVSSVWMDYVLGAFDGRFLTVTLRKDERTGHPGRGAAYSAELELPSSVAQTDANALEGVFRVRARDERGAVSRPFTRTLLGEATLTDVSPSIDLERHKDYAEIRTRVSPGFLRPRICIVNGDTLWLDVVERGDGLYTARYKFQPLLSDAATAACVVETGRSRRVSVSKPLGVHTVRKGWEGEVWTPDGGAGFVFDRETFYEDVYVSMEKGDRGGLAEGLKFASDVFSLSPYDVVFDKTGTVVIRCDGDVAVADRVGVYRKDSGKKWSYLGATVDSVKRTVGANVRTFSEFALIKDDASPSISSVHPRRGRVVRSTTPPVFAVVRDVGSGLGWQGMRVSIDGKKVLCEWDPRISRLGVVYDEPLCEGEHTVVFEVEDKAGNKSRAETDFRVAR